MESEKFRSLLDDLASDIDDVEEALKPLLDSTMAEVSSKLPVLDKAKLHVLVTYALESIIFSTLRLNGVNAREHPVFTELNRVKQYFDKIKEAENGGEKPRENLSLDKDAAGRFIKNALAGNDKYDRERATQQAQEKKNAHIRFEEISDKVGATQRFKGLADQKDTKQPNVESNGSTNPKKHPLSESSNREERDDRGKNTSNREIKDIAQRKRSKKEKDPNRRHKSDTAPKSSRAVFDELLKRSSDSKQG